MDEVEVDAEAFAEMNWEDEDRKSVASSLATALPSLSDPKPPSKKSKQESKRRCRMCAKWQPEDSFPVNSAYCRCCKQAVDNLAKQAARQNQLEYWKEVRKDEQELKKLVTRYNDTCPRGAEKSKRGNFSLASYREVYAASSSSAAKARGRMMWEGYFVEFAQKPKGGSYTEEEARKRWKEMLEDPDVEKDNLGPAKSSRRCCVATYDEVSHGSKLSHAKTQDLLIKKDAKNVSAEQAAKDRRSLLQGHERGALNKNGEILDFAGAISGMLANSSCGVGGKLGAGGGGFAGHGAFVPDISMLKKEIEEDESGAAPGGSAEEPNAGKGAGGGAPDEESGKPGKKRPAEQESPPPKKAKWFDAEAAWNLETLHLASFFAECDVAFLFSLVLIRCYFFRLHCRLCRAPLLAIFVLTGCEQGPLGGGYSFDQGEGRSSRCHCRSRGRHE